MEVVSCCGQLLSSLTVFAFIQIEDLLNNDKVKRDLLSQLIVKYEGAVLEHDANNAAFLFEINDFYCILQIDIGKV